MRVIAGRFKGRRLHAPKGLSTRPTTDRVREALFQILGDLSGARVVDVYAGTGALGIEALSRGAIHATFVESGKVAADVIRDNLDRLGVGDATLVVKRPVERCRAALEPLAPFDLVLSDPPWNDADRAARDVTMAFRGLLRSSGILVMGHRSKSPVDAPDGWSLTDRRSWGDSGLSFFAPRADAASNGL